MASRKSAKRPAAVRRMLSVFYGVSALTLIVISAGAVIATQNVARDQALEDAIRSTARLGLNVFKPTLIEALTNPVAAEELRKSIANRTTEGYLQSVVVWELAGGVLYSNDSIETSFEDHAEHGTPAEAEAAIRSEKSYAGFAETADVVDENAAQSTDGYVEVYVPLDLPGRGRVALEAYWDYGRVNEVSDGLLKQLLPLVLVPLVILQLIQLPIGAALARRVRRHESERSRLLEQSLSVSERERIRIAADLHDGPIQDLAGIGYALGAVAPSVAADQQQLMSDVQTSVHRAIESLRRLMVDLYPPDLTSAQLPSTIADLTVPLRDRGIAVEAHLGALPELSGDVVTTLYRVARESLANVLQHSQATAVRVVLQTVAVVSNSTPVVELTIEDNGVGLDPAQLDRRAEGHLGLRLLIDRVHSLDGAMTLTPSAAPLGLRVCVQLPVQSGPDEPTRPFALIGQPATGRR